MGEIPIHRALRTTNREPGASDRHPPWGRGAIPSNAGEGPYASQRLLAAGIRPKRHELVNELAIGHAQMFWMCVYQ